MTSPRTVNGLAATPGGDCGSARKLPVLNLSPNVYAQAQNCVQCGLCLSDCPTYVVNGLEADSPRGRIHLMKGLADGRIEATQPVLRHLDLCLDCRACETACPSGVEYHHLIEQTRASLESAHKRSFRKVFVDKLILGTFPYPDRLKLALLPARILQKLGLWESLKSIRLDPLAKMLAMLPPGPIWESSMGGRRYRAASRREGQTKATVALFAGCVSSVLFQRLNRQAIALLQLAGCDVVVPRFQQCCGAMHHHSGQIYRSKQLARANIRAFQQSECGADFIVNLVAGCGAMLKEYPDLFRGDPTYAGSARAFADRVVDISQALVRFKPTAAPPYPISRTVSYHGACHLVHAQKITEEPREVLSWVRGLAVRPLSSALCCGAAGIYNLTEPTVARQLAQRKIREILETGTRLCVTGNIGCAMHIQSEAQQIGVDLVVVHPIELLSTAFGVK